MRVKVGYPVHIKKQAGVKQMVKKALREIHRIKRGCIGYPTAIFGDIFVLFQ